MSKVIAAPIPRRALRLAGALLLTAVLLGAWASAAAAHAVLLDVDPADGSALEVVPDAVRLTFNEPVDVPTDGVRVFDADAQRVDTGPLDTGDARVIGVALPEALPEGGYVVTYRVISADSHPIGGVTTFVVGDGTIDDDLVGGLLEANATGAGLEVDLARWASYLTVLLAGGAWFVAWRVVRRPHDRSLTRDLGRAAALLALPITAVAVVVQAAALSGRGLGAVGDLALLRDVMTSSFGTGVVVRVVGLGLLLTAWSRAAGRGRQGVAGLGALLAVGSFALDGHQRSVEPSALLVTADVLHLVAGAFWFAGLVVLALVLRGRGVQRDPVAIAGSVARFSSWALISVGVLAAAGVAMALPMVGSADALTGTTYGRLLIGKTLLVGLVVLIAAYNRQRLVPLITSVRVPAGGSADHSPAGTPGQGGTVDRDAARSGDGEGPVGSGAPADVVSDDTPVAGGRAPVSPEATSPAVRPGVERAWRRLRRTVALEASVLVAVLGVTGVLVATQPAVEAAGLGGWYETTAELGDGLELDLVVDPNRAGRNTIHIYVLDETGRPSPEVQDVVMALTFVEQGIGPIVVEPLFAGTGHWIATVEDMTFPGEWEVRVTAGLDRFTERTTTVTVPVAP